MRNICILISLDCHHAVNPGLKKSSLDRSLISNSVTAFKKLTLDIAASSNPARKELTQSILEEMQDLIGFLQFKNRAVEILFTADEIDSLITTAIYILELLKKTDHSKRVIYAICFCF